MNGEVYHITKNEATKHVPKRGKFSRIIFLEESIYPWGIDLGLDTYLFFSSTGIY